MLNSATPYTNDNNQQIVFNEGVDNGEGMYSGYTARRDRLKYGGRPKAFWGTLASAGLNFVGNIVGGAMKAKSQREQNQVLIAQKQEEMKRNIINQNAANVTATLNNLAQANNMYEPEDETYVYAKGGKARRRLRNPLEITDGGVALPIDQSTFLLRGSSHQDTNETGQTGIGINYGGNEIEAEGGEVIQEKNGDLRVFSAQPMLDGVSPADAVLAGANKDAVFNAQEDLKKLPRRGYMLRCGGKVRRPKARWGIKADGTYGYIPDEWGKDITLNNYDENNGYGVFWGPLSNSEIDRNVLAYNLNKDIQTQQTPVIAVTDNQSDSYSPRRGLRPGLAYGVNTGLDFLGSLGSALISDKYLRDADKLYDSINFKFGTPVDEVYIPASTRVYTGARQAQLNNARLAGMRTVARNTASSNVANARMQDINSQYTDKVNQLWEDAANKNLEMRRANIERAQGVAARNADRRSRFSQANAEMYNKLALGRINNRLLRGNNWASLVASAASSAANGIQNYLDYQTNGANIALASLPYLRTNKQRQQVWDYYHNTYRGGMPYITFS